MKSMVHGITSWAIFHFYDKNALFLCSFGHFMHPFCINGHFMIQERLRNNIINEVF
jgi:hypothetical protein